MPVRLVFIVRASDLHIIGYWPVREPARPEPAADGAILDFLVGFLARIALVVFRMWQIMSCSVAQIAQRSAQMQVLECPSSWLSVVLETMSYK